jgi:hypothetical protein
MKIYTQYARLFWGICIKLIKLVVDHIERKRNNYEFKFLFAQQRILCSLFVNFEMYFEKENQVKYVLTCCVMFLQ